MGRALSSLWPSFCSANVWCKWPEGKYSPLCGLHVSVCLTFFFFFFLQPFKNVNSILSSRVIKETRLDVELGPWAAVGQHQGHRRAACTGDVPGRTTREGVGTGNAPPQGPGPGLSCPLSSAPLPTAPPHAPAVHNDGAGAAPVALVHFPATRSGCEGGGHQHTPVGLSFFLCSPSAQGRGGKRAGAMRQGRGAKNQRWRGWHWACLVT